MKLLVFDIETSISDGLHGPDFRDPTNDFYTVIYGSTPTDVVIEHNRDGFSRSPPIGMLEKLKNTDIIIGHNLGFDLPYIWGCRELTDFILRGGVIWDTQVAEYILTAQQHQYSSLADLQVKYLGKKEKLDRISKLYAQGVGADKIVQKGRKAYRLWSEYEKYCKLDGSTTLEIFKAQYIRAQKEDMLNIVKLYQDYLLSLINMTCTGIELDIVKCEQTRTDFNLKHIEYLEKAQGCITSVWNNPRLPKFNINSPDHKSAVLFGGEVKNVIRTKVGKYKNGNDKYANVQHKIWIDGFQIPKSITRPTKKQGYYATDSLIMKEISVKTRNPVIKNYCELQKEAMMYKKASKTYVEAFINLSVEGKLYPNFNNVATTTGRLSSSKPNMQNVSKRNKFGKILHRLFVAPKGWKCVQMDFSQLEVWVMAWLSQDKLLTKHLLDGVDMHCVRLGYYSDKSYEELVQLCKTDAVPEWVSARSAAKTVSYQMAYGAQPPKVAESTGLPLETVELIYEKEAETYPGTINLSAKVVASIEKSATFSMGKNIPASQKKGINGNKFYKNIEMLPIFDKCGNISYTKEEFRKVGYWTSPIGKKYHFLQTGRAFGNRINKGFSFTQPKNYPMQGTAADIQGATTAELLKLLTKHPDKIKMINEVHDSKWFYVKEEFMGKILPKIQDIIEDVPKIFSRRFGNKTPFKFPVDVEIGDNFADMESYSRETTDINLER